MSVIFETSFNLKELKVRYTFDKIADNSLLSLCLIIECRVVRFFCFVTFLHTSIPSHPLFTVDILSGHFIQ